MAGHGDAGKTSLALDAAAQFEMLVALQIQIAKNEIDRGLFQARQSLGGATARSHGECRLPENRCEGSRLGVEAFDDQNVGHAALPRETCAELPILFMRLILKLSHWAVKLHRKTESCTLSGAMAHRHGPRSGRRNYFQLSRNLGLS